MTVLDSNQRLNDVTDVWKKNRCISSRVAVIYCRWIKRFVAYCKERGVAPEAELTHAGVLSFAKWYARSQDLTVGCTLSAARSALHAWRDALETGGKSLPPSQPELTLLQDISPLLREFAEDMRQHRGNPAAIPCLRIRSLMGTPDSPSFKISAICASLNLDFLIALLRRRRVYYWPVSMLGELTHSRYRLTKTVDEISNLACQPEFGAAFEHGAKLHVSTHVAFAN